MISWAWVDSSGVCMGSGVCMEGDEPLVQANMPNTFTFIANRPGFVRSGQGWVYDFNNQTWSQLPPVLPTLQQLKTAKLALLDDLAWNKRQFFTYDGETDAFCDRARGPIVDALTSRNILTTMTGTEPPPQSWQLSATAWRTWGTAELINYGLAIGNFVQSNFDYKLSLANQINAASNETQLNNINITVGWP